MRLVDLYVVDGYSHMIICPNNVTGREGTSLFAFCSFKSSYDEPMGSQYVILYVCMKRLALFIFKYIRIHNLKLNKTSYNIYMGYAVILPHHICLLSQERRKGCPSINVIWADWSG